MPAAPTARLLRSVAPAAAEALGAVESASMAVLTFAFVADELPDGRIMVICRSGNRSRQVCEFLKSQGRDAVNVSDGTMGWADRGWPLES